ncbi:hypothetical protein [uncultured Sphingomonas sp.]|uniref:hypothetical protein n=1 Tax=uncultured Sphingomonas sp. TaxID=158754 RepID=UPI002599B325|nr:hypothetical protein [uncultured Sphingomonas sp.]
MTSDQLDAYAARLAHQTVELAGGDDAPGVLLQAMMLVAFEHHSFDAPVFSLERSVAKMRADLVSSLTSEGTIQ